MNRLLAVTGILIFALGAAHAGTIVEIGQTSGGNNLGLTNTYITTALNNGTKTAFTEVGYSTILFQGATGIATPPMATTTTPNYVSDPTNGGVTFAMIGDNPGGTKNGWENTSVSSNTITIPINLLDADTVWTMINDINGDTTSGKAATINVTFYFNAADTMTGATSETITLVNGQEVRSSTLCGTPGVSTGCPGTQPVSVNVGTTYFTTVGSTLTGSGTLASNLSSIAETNGSVLYSSGTYSGIAAGVNSGSSGTMTLDDQSFSFGTAFQNDYLVAMTITDVATPTTDALDHMVLSAVSVDVYAPEPSTLVFFLCGVGLFGIAHKRMRRA